MSTKLHSFTRRQILACGSGACLWMIASGARALARPNLIVRRNRLYLPASVNGHPVLALLDSAAETSLVDSGFARQIGLKPRLKVTARGSGGDSDAELVDGVTIRALGETLGPLTVGKVDLSDVARRLVGMPLPLILGRELFDATRLYIDIDHGRIEPRALSNAPPGTRLDLAKSHGIETFSVAFENHAPVQAAFDLGNANEVLISTECATKSGLLGDGRKIVEKKGGGIGGERLRKTFFLKSLQVAGRRFENVPVAIDPDSSATDLNIGVQILRHFIITVDFSRSVLWLAPLPE